MADRHMEPKSGTQVHPGPHLGRAPEPSRTAEIASGPNMEMPMNEVPSGTPGEATAPNTQPQPPAPPQPTVPGVQSSPPPAAPESASELAALRQQVGELVQGIGNLKASHAREVEEMRLMMEMNQANQLAPQIPPMGVPEGVDPDQEMKVGDFFQYFNGIIGPVVTTAQAQALRGMWDVTAEEETAVLQAYPNLQVMPEPNRTNFIQKAVALRRQATAGPASPTPAQAAQASPQPAPSRPAPPTVPHVEHTPAPAVPDFQPKDELVEARREYDEAKASQANSPAEHKERLRKMRAATDKINALLGNTEEMQRGSGFKQIS